MDGIGTIDPPFHDREVVRLKDECNQLGTTEIFEHTAKLFKVVRVRRFYPSSKKSQGGLDIGTGSLTEEEELGGDMMKQYTRRVIKWFGGRVDHEQVMGGRGDGFTGHIRGSFFKGKALECTETCPSVSSGLILR